MFLKNVAAEELLSFPLQLESLESTFSIQGHSTYTHFLTVYIHVLKQVKLWTDFVWAPKDLALKILTLAMSIANWIALDASTTKPDPSCKTWYSDPNGTYWVITTKFGGELQHPITGITFGWEKIRNFGYSSLKSLEILGVHSLKARTLAAISLPCHLPCHVSPKMKIIKISFYKNKTEHAQFAKFDAYFNFYPILLKSFLLLLYIVN